MTGGNVTEDQQKLKDEIEDLNRKWDNLIEKAYLMGYNRGLRHKENTPKFP